MALDPYPKLLIVLAAVSCSGLCGFFAFVALYRLFLHPLRKVPGPTLAAITRLYDFYYDCILRGKFAFEIEKLHKTYGISNTDLVLNPVKEFPCGLL